MEIGRIVFPDLHLHVGLQLIQVLALLADLLLELSKPIKPVSSPPA
jgi:hypothetical protein